MAGTQARVNKKNKKQMDGSKGLQVKDLIADGYQPSQQGLLQHPMTKQLLQELALVTLRDVSRPLNPLLDYFRDEQGQLLHLPEQTHISTPATPSPRAAGPAVDPTLIARIPAKASPCRRCPALSGGLCKCAMKRVS